jgi:hypothetical protein
VIAIRSSFALAPAVLGLVLAAACKPDLPSEPPELDPGEHLLITPRGNPDELLGRTVTAEAGGGYRVSDERPAGCEVNVRRVPERWQRTYQQDAGRAAHIGTGKTPVGELQIKHGKSVRIDANIDNIEVLEADLRGCTGTVVKSVKVGTGKREFRALDETSVDVKVNAKGVPVGAGGGKWKNVGRALEWSEPQAWAFSVEDLAGSTDMHVELVLMPDSLADGEEFSIRIISAQQVWLVVGFVAESGSSGIILPNGKQPTPSITAGGNVELVLRAKLNTPGVTQRDRFVLYAFSERGDFDMFKPPTGQISAAVAAKYFEELPARLQSIPTRRWTKTEGYLLIEAPAAAGPTQ